MNKNKELIKNLKIVLANTFAIYLKSHYFHWNVTGPDFPQLHTLFDSQYNELWESIDSTAEKIRYLDSYAPGSFERFSEMSQIQSALTVPPAEKMITDLMADHVLMLSILNSAIKAAEAVDDQSTLNYLAERLDQHKRHLWMLSATARKTKV
jgi:starvation-inducible DNA-binding protein